MFELVDFRRIGKIRKLAHHLALVSIAIPLLVLISWITGLAILSTSWTGGARMSLGTALLSLLCAGAMLIESRAQGFPSRPSRVARILAAFALSIAGFALVGNALQVTEGVAFAGDIIRGISSATAFCFALLSAAILLARFQVGERLHSTMLALAGGPVLLALAGYAYDAAGLHNMSRFSEMSLPAAVSLAALLSAAILNHGDRGWPRILVARNSAGQTARALLVISLTLPFLTAGLVLTLLARGWIALPIGYAANAVLNALSLSTLSLILSVRLDRSDSARRESQRLIEQIIENTPAVIYVKDREGRYKLVNRQFCENLGVTRKQAIGNTIGNLVPEAEAAAFRASELRVMATGKTMAEEQAVSLHAGFRQYLTLKSPLHDEHGSIVGMFGVTTDISESKRVEARLAAQLDRLKLLHGITRSIDQQSDIATVFGLAVTAIEDKLPADFVCACRKDEADETLKAMFAGTRAPLLAEALGVGNDLSISVNQNGLRKCTSRGELVYEPDILLSGDFPFTRILAAHGMRSVVLSPMPIEGKILGVLIVARHDAGAFLSVDCEFLKQLGEHVAVAAHQAKLRASLQQAYEELKRTQQAVVESERLSAIGQMASGIAHDINNAISPVSVYTQSLIERDLDLPAEVDDYLQMVNGVVRDLAATVARMRDFYRPKSADEQFLPVDLHSLIAQVVDHTRARWHDMPLQRGIVINTSTDLRATASTIQGDAAELREMMTNLVFNAVDAMPGGGTITLRTTNPQPNADMPPEVLLEVVDTGAGMTEEVRRRCLDPFFTTKGERGTGLGLAMVYGAVQRHQGQLEIQSMSGVGTTFGLRFPAVSAPVIRKKPERRSLARSLRLLVVDDDPAVLQSTRIMLERDGHHVVMAGGGGEGISAMAKAADEATPFDAIITDVGMPFVDGNQVAAATKARSPSSVVVLLTGWGRRMGNEDDGEANVDFVVPKPFELDEMRAVLKAIDERTSGCQDDGQVRDDMG